MGPISTVYAWQPDYPAEPPPQSVIVTQSCAAHCNGQSYDASSSPGAPTCDDGLQDTPTISVTPVYDQRQDPPAFIETQVSGACSGTHCTDMAGAAPLTIPCTPKVSVSLTDGPVHADVAYSVSVSPVTITLTGATLDSNSGWDILVGQGCSPALGGIPNGCTVSNYSWTVTGTTFQQWSPTTPANPNANPPTAATSQASYYVNGPGPLNGPNPNSTPAIPAPHWYWNEAAAHETITCTATVTPPAGQGSAFTVTATQKVSVMVPTWTCTGTGGTMQVNTAKPPSNGTDYWLHAGAGPSTAGGMDWYATVSSPDATLFQDGGIQIVQLVTPNDSYTAGTTTYSWSLNGQIGLDTSCPYPWTEQAPNYFGGDNPGVPLTDGVTGATEKSHFDDYLMYQAPGTDIQWVPLATFSWDTNGSVTIPKSGGWAAFGSGSAGSVTPSGTPVNFSASHSFPEWTQNSGNNAGGHWQ